MNCRKCKFALRENLGGVPVTICTHLRMRKPVHFIDDAEVLPVVNASILRRCTDRALFEKENWFWRMIK